MHQRWEPESEEFRFDREVLHQIFLRFKPYRLLFFFALLLTLLATSAELGMPIVVRKAIDAHIVKRAVRVNGQLIPLGRNISSPPHSEKEIYYFFRRGAVQKTIWEQMSAKAQAVPGAIVSENLIAIPFNSVSDLPSDVRAEMNRIEAFRLIPLAGLFLLLTALFFLFSSLSSYLLIVIGQRMIRSLRLEVHRFLLSQSYAFFLKQPIGKLITRVMNDVDAMGDFFTQVLVTLYRDLLMIAGVLIVMWNFHSTLSLIVLIFALFLLFWLGIFRTLARKNFRLIRTKIAELNTMISEHLFGIPAIKSFVAENHFSQKFRNLNRETYRVHMKQIHLNSMFFPIVNLMNYLSLGVVLWVGGRKILQAELSLGILIAFLAYIEMLYTPIRDLVERYPILQASLAAAEKIFSLLRIDTRVAEPLPAYAVSLPQAKGEIEFQDVWLAYDTEWVLKGVSFRIAPGEKVAIVGFTGAGKTSLIHLLLKFFVPQKGKILLDGVDISQIPTQQLRSHFALVPQEEYIFHGRLSDNIRLFDTSIPEEAMEESAKNAGMEWFLNRLAVRWEEEIGERGVNLSVGQKQFISLMRALVRHPAVLLLDEATSHLDPESEQYLQEGMRRLLAGRTAVVVAHRLSTLRFVDRILILHQGSLLESGTHQELLEKNGIYARWVALFAPLDAK